MEKITYYNAGAGSGKTHTLISELVKLIKSGDTKPQEVILTTFTEKAAAEFREKAKARLYEERMFEEALQIDNAMIGTVHSVCAQMIEKYWYMLGLTPKMGVMDDESKQFYISQSLGDIPSPEEISMLHKFAYNFAVPNEWRNGVDKDFWRSDLESIIAYATNYEISDFTNSEQHSLNFIRQFASGVGGNATISDDELEAIIKEMKAYIDSCKKPLKKDLEPYEALRALAVEPDHKTVNWRSKVAKLIDSRFGPLSEAMSERLSNLWQTKEVYDAQAEYIRIIFSLAARWQNAYSDFKTEKNLIDFNDMEHHMYRLLRNKNAREDIRQSYHYLFVDEFQDCSPLQIKMFTALSEIMDHSYWVGDYKQSIYGFRGTDIDMVKAVTDNIPKTIPLETSWRSLEPIVEFNNRLFLKIFSNKLTYKEIHLDSHRKSDSSLKSLRYFLKETKTGFDAACVKKILEQDHVQPKDLAILAQANQTLKDIAKELRALGIPSSLGQNQLHTTQTWTLVQSLLGILENPSDMLSRAQVALLTAPDHSTREIVEKRLMNRDTSFLSEVPLVGKALAIRDTLRTRSIAALVEQMIVELGLFQVVKQVEDIALDGTDCLQTILSYAKKYEEYCLQLNISASIPGFIQYFILCFKDPRKTSFGNPEGVQLFTYHGSKGLEWKYVILTSLDAEITSNRYFMRHNLYGVTFERSEKPTAQNPNPEVYLRVTPWIYGTSQNLPPAIDVIMQESETFQNTLADIREEKKRLLYVGMTRPRDVLITAIRKTGDTKTKKGGPKLTFLHEMGYADAGTKDPENDGWDIFATGDKFVNFTPTEDETAELSIPGETTEKMLILPDIDLSKQPSERRYISPSGVKATSQIGEVKDFGQRIPLAGNNPDMTGIGNCIHHIFAGIEEKRASDIDLRDIVRVHKLESALTDADAIKTAWDNLVSHLTAAYGPAVRTWHERPFRMEKDGQTVVGSIDLVWQTAGGDILIDYKTNPEGASVITNPQSDHFAGHYGGQLSTYREALEAAGETVLKTMLYYPVSGLLVELNK